MAKSPPKIVDPQHVFIHATQFHSALYQLQLTVTNPQEDLPRIFGPLIVLTTFSCELFLKALFAEENNGAVIYQHLLWELFEALSPATQAKIEAEWDKSQLRRKELLDRADNESGNLFPRDLRSNLSQSSDLFVVVRYLYENSKPFEFNIIDLPYILRQVILELKPEWDLASTTPNKPHTAIVKSKDSASQIGLTLDAIVDDKTTPFQWGVRWH